MSYKDSKAMIKKFYELQLVGASELILTQVGLPRTISKKVATSMSIEEMQEFLDNHAVFLAESRLAW
ncbi:hypothetical protein [Pseudomonas aeruginosa]|uniref:hypothetical protein n=1 Tax=Pseudomonas aeruginosa TaxID=287 RepID=UPI0012986FF7|nr:hypothetical protein [Pseudomonas aeruginosa]MDV6777030.1 hypothetical protein [Pseudomonas aeruginosa]